uniref:Tumor necrosis factor n=1 Tax=Denticeps clupeoides TaxID=299321 RepID=A0AAY4DJJ9_9TELE
MAKDSEMIPDMEEGLTRSLVAGQGSSPSVFSGGRLKVFGALLAVALCTAAALCISLQNHVNLRHTLRQLAEKTKYRAAIHLDGEVNTKISNTSVVWRVDRNQAIQEGGLLLKENEVHIPRGGLYFVYSQVSFRINCQADPRGQEDLGTVLVGHKVRRWSDMIGHTVTMLEALRSSCRRVPHSGPDSGERWHSVVYLGAVFRLESGDRLSTTIEQLPYVEEGYGQTFFGVFAL